MFFGDKVKLKVRKSEEKLKSWNFSFSFFSRLTTFFTFFQFFFQKCFKILFFSVKKPRFFVPKLGIFVPKEGKIFFVLRRERFFLSCGGKDFFCPTDKKNHSLLRTKKIIPSFGQKKLFPPSDKNKSFPPSEQKNPTSGQKNLVSSREKEDCEAFLAKKR